MNRPAAKPDWPAVTFEALQTPASLMRVLAAMGFTKHVATVRRGDVATWFPPTYLAAGLKHPHRTCFAAVNRAMRDAEVHLMRDAAGITAVCSYQGEWRTPNGAQAGDDLASLGAVRWGCRYGQAAGRIAQIVGLRRIPDATTITPAAVFQEVHARMRQTAEAAHA